MSDIRCFFGHHWIVPWTPYNNGQVTKHYDEFADPRYDLPTSRTVTFVTYCERCGEPKTKKVKV